MISYQFRFGCVCFNRSHLSLKIFSLKVYIAELQKCSDTTRPWRFFRSLLIFSTWILDLFDAQGQIARSRRARPNVPHTHRSGGRSHNTCMAWSTAVFKVRPLRLFQLRDLVCFSVTDHVKGYGGDSFHTQTNPDLLIQASRAAKTPKFLTAMNLIWWSPPNPTDTPFTLCGSRLYEYLTRLWLSYMFFFCPHSPPPWYFC